jgi:hypothetical protein
MNPALKVGLWIGGAIAALLAVIVIAGIVIANIVGDDIQQAETFAKQATHDACVQEIARRVGNCDGIRCTLRVSAFGGTCLTQAQGNLAEFCSTVPRPSGGEGMQGWRPGFCESRGFDEKVCNVTTGLMATACETAKSRPAR